MKYKLGLQRDCGRKTYSHQYTKLRTALKKQTGSCDQEYEGQGADSLLRHSGRDAALLVGAGFSAQVVAPAKARRQGSACHA